MPLFFSDREFRTAEAAIDILVPAEGRVLTATEIAERADQFLATVEPPNGAEIRRGLALLEFWLPVLVGKLPPFSSLSRPARRQVLERIIRGSGLLRDLARSLKLITVFSYYTHPKAREAIGYVDFEQRPRFPGLDTTVYNYPPPHGP